jgi:hypothetical protein
MSGNDFRRYYKLRNQVSPLFVVTTEVVIHVRSNDFSRFFYLFCGDRLLALAELTPGNDFRRYYKRRDFSPVRSNDFGRFWSFPVKLIPVALLFQWGQGSRVSCP